MDSVYNSCHVKVLDGHRMVFYSSGYLCSHFLCHNPEYIQNIPPGCSKASTPKMLPSAIFKPTGSTYSNAKYRLRQYFMFMACFRFSIFPPYLTLMMDKVIGYTTTVKIAYDYAITAAFVNSFLNSLVYCWRIGEIRRAVKNILRRLWQG